MGRPRKPKHDTPVVRGDLLYTDDTAYTVGSDAWYAWLRTATRFSVEHPLGSFFCRKEHRKPRGGDYWYANRRVNRQAFHRSMGKRADRSAAHIEEGATMMNNSIVEQGTTPMISDKQRIDLPQIATVRTDDTMLWIDLTDGRVIGAPMAWFPRLQQGTPAQRTNWRLQIAGTAINWPELDEDISVRVLMNVPS